MKTKSMSTLFMMVCAISLVGCGGTSAKVPAVSGDPPPAPVSVIVTPSGIGQVWQGTQVQFSARVNGITDQSISWSIKEGASGGNIDSNGLYTAPSASGTFHVIATSQSKPTASGSASVEVPPLTVAITPPALTLRIGGQRVFSGFALAADQNVTWKLQEGPAAGTITPEGVYTAPEQTGAFHLIATSVFNTKVSSTAPITIVSVGFSQTGDMKTARSGHTATLLFDGRVLVAGGTSDMEHSAELFDPAAGNFGSVSGQMIHLRSRHCASRLRDGRVLIVGGDDGSGTFLTTAEIFDPATKSFAPMGDLNVARTSATATLLPDGNVLIAGGRDAGGKLLSSAELFNPSTGTFSLTGAMHLARAQHTATLLSNGEVLLMGSSSDTASAELFNPTSEAFSVTGSLIQARFHQTATLLPNGNVLVLGGSQIRPPGGGGAPAAPVSIDSAEIYDVANGVFKAAGKLLTSRDSHSATLLANGSVLVAGGYVHTFDGDAQPEWYTIADTEQFEPVSSVSTTASALAQGRAEHSATILNNGEVLITGGVSGFQELCCKPKPVVGPLSSAEIYK